MREGRQDEETGTADDRITAEQIAVLRKYLDNMEKQHLRDAAKELEGVSVHDLLARVFPVDVSAMVDKSMFQGWLEVRRRLDRLAKCEAALRLAQYYMRLPPEPTSSDHEKYNAALEEVSAVLEGR